MTDHTQSHDPRRSTDPLANDPIQAAPGPDGSPRTASTQPPVGAQHTGQSFDASSQGDARGTADVAKDEASNVKDTAVDAGRRVAGTAKEEASNVASEAKTQAKALFDEAKHELQGQAKTQQGRAAEGLQALGGQLSSMAQGQDGLAGQLVGEVGTRAEAAARWIGDREPADLLQEVQSFARRRPGTFIAIAAAAGLVVGRLARGMASGDDAAAPDQASGRHAIEPRTAYGYDERRVPQQASSVVDASRGASSTPIHDATRGVEGEELR